MAGNTAEGGPSFFVLRLAMYHQRIALVAQLFPAVPYFFNKGAGGIILVRGNTQGIQFFLNGQGSAESGDDDHIFGRQLIEGDERFAVGILQELYPMLLQVGIHLGVVDHFTQQENALTGVFLHASVGNFNSILHPIAEPEMPGQVDLNGPEVEQRGGEVFLKFIVCLAPGLDGRNQRAAVKGRNIELLHGAKIDGGAEASFLFSNKPTSGKFVVI